MANESYCWNQQTITSTTHSDHVFNVADALKRPARHCMIRNAEGYTNLTGDSLSVRFNGDSNQTITLFPGENLTVDFQIYKIECAAIGTSGANDAVITILVS